MTKTTPRTWDFSFEGKADRVLDSIRILNQIAHKKTFDVTEEEVERKIREIDEALNLTRTLLKSRIESNKVR